MAFRESLHLELKISTPRGIAAKEIISTVGSAEWSFEIDLMFDISCKTLKVSEVSKLSESDGEITWNVEVDCTVVLVPDEPLPRSHYDSSTTREYITVEPNLPKNWEITETSIT